MNTPTNGDRERLLRYLSDELTAEEKRTLEGRLAHDPELHARLARLENLRAELRAARPASFGPYFSERVIGRLTPQAPYDALYPSLKWIFARAAVAGVALAAGIGAYNAVFYRQLGLVGSIVEAVFGLPSASLSEALSYGAF